MPSKNYNGQNPLGRRRISKSRGAFGAVEKEVGRIQPALSLHIASKQLPNGRIVLPKKTARGSTETCQLGDLMIDSENSTEQETKYKIRPGFVSGGGGNELVEPDNLTKTAGHSVWLEIAWTCEVVDGVQQAGGTMGAITVGTGESIPTDTVPTGAGAATAHIPLGAWDGSGSWIKQGCGSIQVYFCPGGGFFFGRDNSVEV